MSGSRDRSEPEPERPVVVFKPPARSVTVEAGATVMDAALMCGVWIDAPCGGEGRCGKCRVRASGGLSPPGEAERGHLSGQELAEGFRLACQARVEGRCTVEPAGGPAWSAAKSSLVGGGPLRPDLPGLVPPPGRWALGAAVDIGTTTLSVSCLDLATGERISVASAENPQAVFGADVMTRIERCRRDPSSTGMMHRSVVSAVNGLLEKVTGASAYDIFRLVAVGNTTMVSLALGLDPSPLGSHPFEPPTYGPVEIRPGEIGIHANESARLILPRLLSGFLGADIVAALLATGAADSETVTMVVDLGTNGEIAVGDRGGIYACSTAAGPAFEGAQISSGMRAAPGAIESFSRDGRLEPRVLGGGVPRGICGSGILDAVSALLESGLISPGGRLLPPEESDSILPGRVRRRGSVREFILAPGTGLTLTQDDIREVQLAKGAVSAGIRVLCERAGLDYKDVEKVFLAGAFGNFIRPASAVSAGLLPEELADRVLFAGNAALTGAEMMLVSEDRWDSALRIPDIVEVVELSGDRRFERLFIENLSFPSKNC